MKGCLCSVVSRGTCISALVRFVVDILGVVLLFLYSRLSSSGSVIDPLWSYVGYLYSSSADCPPVRTSGFPDLQWSAGERVRLGSRCMAGVCVRCISFFCACCSRTVISFILLYLLLSFLDVCVLAFAAVWSCCLMYFSS